MATEPEPTFQEALQAALGRMGFATVKPGEMPRGRDLLAAVGGVRGLIESILPGLAFLVVYTISFIVLELPNYLLLSVSTPVVLGLLFLVVRLVARQPIRSAISGIVLAAVMAGVSLFTGRPEDAFIPGIIINIVCLVVVLVSLAVRWPIIGVFVGALTGDLTGWRADRAKRRVLTIATVLWAGLFAVRLLVEVPLYLAGYVDWLAAAKLFLGVPFYAVLLWISWLLVGTVFAASGNDTAETEASR